MKASNSDRYIKSTEVRKLLGGISTTTLWRRVKDGTIPKPVKLGGGSTNFFKESWITCIINGEET
jgi:predicted DNA-binding transcriptional regulator AlpA